MAAIRRSGGVVAFHWDGKIAEPRTAAFAEALAQRRFRSIEKAASEEVSAGWVTPADPTGDSFAPEDLDGGTGTWLRFRIDKKVLPKKWLQIHRDAAEKARGKKMSARERRELKDDLTEKLLPRVLPAVQLIDALLFFAQRTVLLFGTGKGARETFGKLFFESFGTPLERATPLVAGLRAGLGESGASRLERLDPMRWPRAERTGPAPRTATRRPAAAPDAATEQADASAENDA
ncbi:MAG: recombination-associated protein RdgC [Planctomycetota bacterium]